MGAFLRLGLGGGAFLRLGLGFGAFLRSGLGFGAGIVFFVLVCVCFFNNLDVGVYDFGYGALGLVGWGLGLGLA